MDQTRDNQECGRLVLILIRCLLLPVHPGGAADSFGPPSVSTPDSVLGLDRITNTEDATATHYVYTRQNIECKASFAVHPTTVENLQDIVHYSLKHNLHVKAVGSQHAGTDTICTDGILVDMRNISHFSFNHQSNQATAGAGMKLFEFLKKLHDYRRGLPGTPTYSGVTMGGSVAAGTHGTNLKEAATLSDQVVSLKFVDGMGNLRELRKGDEDFKAMKVNLGLLGIVYELTFATTEQYKLEMRNFPLNDEILWREGAILEMANEHDSLQIFWFPTNKEIVVMAGNKVPISVPGECRANSSPGTMEGNPEMVYGLLEQMQNEEDDLGYFYAQSLAKLGLTEEVPGRLPFYTQESGEIETASKCRPVAVGYSHKIITSSYNPGFHPLAYDHGAVAVDLDEMPEALKTLKEITDENLVEFPLVGMNFRFLRESDAYMGLTRNKKSLQVEWISMPRTDSAEPKLGITAFQAIGQALIGRHGARPHWANNGLYYTTRPVLERAFPDLQKFVEVMNRLDPHEIFMNDFGQRLKHGGSEMSLTQVGKQRCALNEACLCSTDLDCGDGTETAYECGDYKEFKVCKKRSTPANILKGESSRDAINSAGKLVDVNSVEALMKELVTKRVSDSL